MSNVLKSQGVKKGDRVAIYYPVSPNGVAAMLACAKIGAVHSVIFAGFSSDALRSGEKLKPHFFPLKFTRLF